MVFTITAEGLYSNNRQLTDFRRKERYLVQTSKPFIGSSRLSDKKNELWIHQSISFTPVGLFTNSFCVRFFAVGNAISLPSSLSPQIKRERAPFNRSFCNSCKGIEVRSRLLWLPIYRPRRPRRKDVEDVYNADSLISDEPR